MTRPILLLNGIGAGRDQWGDLPERLGRPTIAIDPPEVGRFPSMGEYARAVERTVDRIDMGPLDVLGFSWGAVLTLELAMRDSLRTPRRFGSVVVAYGLPGYTSVPTFALQAAAAMWSHERRGLNPQAVYGDDVTAEDLQRMKIDREVDPVSYRKQQVALFRSLPVLPRLPLIKHHTLVVSGRNDQIVNPLNGPLMAFAIPRARLHCTDTGHLGLLTRSSEMAAVIDTFLDKGNKHSDSQS